MKLMTFVFILGITLMGCSQEKTPPERQEEFDFDREELEIQREEEQRERTSRAFHQDAKEEEVD